MTATDEIRCFHVQCSDFGRLILEQNAICSKFRNERRSATKPIRNSPIIACDMPLFAALGARLVDCFGEPLYPRKDLAPGFTTQLGSATMVGMAFLYLDDSKHHRFGFSLAAFVICDVDPTEEVTSIFRNYGYDASSFEYKSSAKMKGDSNRQNLRAALKLFITKKCRIAVCIVNGDKKLGPAGLTLLQNALHHPQLNGIQHEIFFDEGLFSSVRAAETLVENAEKLSCCRFHFEQNSRDVLGIQIADIVAHTCGTMLLDTLGHISKTIDVDEPGDSVYHGMEVELGFEMWAGIRYAFLSRNKSNPKDDFELANVDVYPWGLFVDDSVDELIASAAMERFGKMYLGCIH